MKKLILSIMAAGLAATSFAHSGMGSCAPQGGLLLYGVGSYSNTHGTTTSKFSSANANTVDEPRILKWEVSPGVGFNVMDCLTIGVDFNYTGSKTTYDRKDPSIYGNNPLVPSTYGEDQVKTYDYAIGPFVRYSMPIGEHFFAYGQFEAHYLRGQMSTRTITNSTGGNSFVRDDKYKGVDGSLTPAFGVMVCKSVALTFGFGGVSYVYQKYDYSPQGYSAGTELSAKNNKFDVTFGQQFNIGVQKTFSCGMMHHHGGNAEPMDDTRHMDTSDDTNTNTDDSNMDNGGRKKHRRHRKNDDE